jgi:hypothetical protein
VLCFDEFLTVRIQDSTITWVYVSSFYSRDRDSWAERHLRLVGPWLANTQKSIMNSSAITKQRQDVDRVLNLHATENDGNNAPLCHKGTQTCTATVAQCHGFINNKIAPCATVQVTALNTNVTCIATTLLRTPHSVMLASHNESAAECIQGGRSKGALRTWAPMFSMPAYTLAQAFSTGTLHWYINIHARMSSSSCTTMLLDSMQTCTQYIVYSPFNNACTPSETPMVTHQQKRGQGCHDYGGPAQRRPHGQRKACDIHDHKKCRVPARLPP